MSKGAYQPLGSVVRLIGERSAGLKDPSKPYVGLEHIRPGGGSLVGLGIAEDSVSLNSSFHAGDVLFGKLRPRLRKSVQVSFEGYCSTDILVLRPSELTHPCFAGYLLQTDTVFDEAIRTEEGTKMPRCSWNTLRKLEVFVPTITQQVSITEILGSLDSAIEQTEALMAKMQQVKAGLMHDILTRGILPNGQLRPSREEAPQLYKESPLGWIPMEWERSTLGQCIVGSFQNGLYKSNARYGEVGIPIVRIDSFYDGKISDINRLKRLELTPSEMRLYRLKEGDLLVNRVNSIEYVGKSALVRSVPEPVVFESNIMRCCVDRERVLPDFLVHWLCSSQGRQHLRARAKNAIAQASINQVDVCSLHVSLPCKTEQSRISERLNHSDSTMQAEIEGRDKLLRLRSGLMHDLLTGRVRIPESMLKKAAAAEVAEETFEKKAMKRSAIRR